MREDADMLKNCWFGIVVLVLVCALGLTTGCRGKKGAKGPGSDNVGGTMGEAGITEQGLASRPEGMEMLPSVKFANVLFDYDSAQVNETERSKIEAVGDFLKKNTKAGVIVEGHCDERGSREYNLALGERRALAARAYLIGLNLDGARIQTKSYGKERPLNPGHDEAAWKENRRAEFVFFNQ